MHTGLMRSLKASLSMTVGLSVVILINCAPSIKRIGYNIQVEAPDSTCEIPVYENLDLDTSKVRVIGSMKVGDAGFSIHCSKREVLDMVRQDACRLKADAVNLTNIREPSPLGSTCYRVTALFLKRREDHPDYFASITADSSRRVSKNHEYYRYSSPLEDRYASILPPPRRFEYGVGGYFFYKTDDWIFNSNFYLTYGAHKNKNISFIPLLPQIRFFIDRNDTTIDDVYQITGHNSCFSIGLFSIVIGNKSDFTAGIQYKGKTPLGSRSWLDTRFTLTSTKRLFLHASYSGAYGMQLLKRISLTIPAEIHWYSLVLTEYTYIEYGRQYLEALVHPTFNFAVTRNYRIGIGGGIAVNKRHTMPLLLVDTTFYL